MISESPHSARLRLNAGDAIMGDTVPRPVDDRLSVSVQVLGGEGSALELHTAEGCVFREVLELDDACIETPMDVSSTPYVRAQLVEWGNASPSVRALTNPVYIR
jgi:hypothetical protein